MENKVRKVSYQLFLVKWVVIGTILFFVAFALILFVYDSFRVKEIREKILLEKVGTKDDVYSWYEDLPLIRGISKDNKAFFIIKINLAYPVKATDKTSKEIFNKRYIIVDILVEYFSKLNEKYLIDTSNRNKIKYSIMESINKILSYPVSDIAFMDYSIEPL